MWMSSTGIRMKELNIMLKGVLERSGSSTLGRIVSPHLESLLNQRPWKEFFSGFKCPSFQDRKGLLRIATNLLYFSGNYLVMMGIFLVIQMFVVQDHVKWQVTRSPFGCMSDINCCSMAVENERDCDSQILVSSVLTKIHNQWKNYRYVYIHSRRWIKYELRE